MNFCRESFFYGGGFLKKEVLLKFLVELDMFGAKLLRKF
jgi:hypothetical protein